ncbi:MAG: c-type cytochrome [Magnetococcales bacterium]|nr:c-type cytochrome [Magnetococcales bacterium]
MQFRQIALYGLIGLSFAALVLGGWFRSQPDVNIGKRLAMNSCGVCHDLTPSQTHERGPYLWGVYGRPAGISGFKHSEAFLGKIQEKSFVWDDEHLNLFIANPSQFIPRTKMGRKSAKHPTAFDGIVSDSNRRDVLAYLKTLR